MYYIPYMILKNQLMDHSKAKLIIEGVEVYFELLPGNNCWVLKARIYYPSEADTPALQETLHSLNYVKIQGGNLKVYPDEGFVILSQETKDLLSFLLFKSTMEDFMNIYDFWKGIVDDMINSHRALVR